MLFLQQFKTVFFDLFLAYSLSFFAFLQENRFFFFDYPPDFLLFWSSWSTPTTTFSFNKSETFLKFLQLISNLRLFCHYLKCLFVFNFLCNFQNGDSFAQKTTILELQEPYCHYNLLLVLCLFVLSFLFF